MLYAVQGPNQTHALGSALTQTGCPDPRNDRIYIMSSCLRQLVLPLYLLAALMQLATALAPYILYLLPRTMMVQPVLPP